MAYPTTLALITALWSGPPRTKSIALWSGTGGAIASLGPLVAGALLEHFYWGSVFLITLPLAVVALLFALKYIPSHVNETSDPVDNLGGVLSVALVGSLILAINFAPVPNKGALVAGLVIIAAAAGIAFVLRQRRAANPLYDLHIAGRRVFWVAACAGIIVFGSLMGAMFIGQQFLQNVLGYSTLSAGAAILPAAILMVLVAPRSAKLVDARGARFTLLTGYVFVFLGFLTMLLLWKEDSSYWEVGLGYAFVGIGRRLRRDPGVAFAHRVGAGPAGRHGVRDRRSPTRPRWRHHAVHLRCAAHRRLRHGHGRRHRRLPGQLRRHRAACSPSSPSRSRAPPTPPSATPSTPARSPPPRSHRSSTAPTGPTPPASSPSSPEPRSCSSCSPRSDEEEALLASYHDADTAVTTPGPD